MGGLFDDDPLSDDDFIDGVYDDEEEEISSDFHVRNEPIHVEDTPTEVRTTSSDKNNSKKRVAKIKVMPKGLQRHNIATMLITRTDGRQILFVNPNSGK